MLDIWMEASAIIFSKATYQVKNLSINNQNTYPLSCHQGWVLFPHHLRLDFSADSKLPSFWSTNLVSRNRNLKSFCQVANLTFSLRSSSSGFKVASEIPDFTSTRNSASSSKTCVRWSNSRTRWPTTDWPSSSSPSARPYPTCKTKKLDRPKFKPLGTNLLLDHQGFYSRQYWSRHRLFSIWTFWLTQWIYGYTFNMDYYFMGGMWVLDDYWVLNYNEKLNTLYKFLMLNQYDQVKNQKQMKFNQTIYSNIIKTMSTYMQFYKRSYYI